jgi:hypothetical protein
MARFSAAARRSLENTGCPDFHRAAQGFATDASKASLKAKIDAFYKHSNCPS